MTKKTKVLLGSRPRRIDRRRPCDRDPDDWRFVQRYAVDGHGGRRHQCPRSFGNSRNG